MRRPRARFVALAALATAAALAFVALPAVAGLRARYGGELRVALPALPAPGASLDPALLSTPSDLALARLLFDTAVLARADGALVPGLLATVPEADSSGRQFRLRLRPGLRFQGGAPVAPADLIASLRRLADPELRSPFAAVALPLAAGNGVAVTPDGELQVTLAFAYPDWPRALAHPAASLVSVAPGAAPLGTGPFALATAAGARAGAAGGGAGDDGSLRLTAFADAALGRPYADAVRLSGVDPRGGARALARGELDLAPVSQGGERASDGAALCATYLALNPARLGAQLGRVRQALEASVDPADLTRYFARAPAVPMAGLLPPALGGPGAAAAAGGGARGTKGAKAALSAVAPLVLLVDESIADQRAVAERIQVRLHDAGAVARVAAMARADLRRALAGGDYDLALVALPLLPEPGMALAQLVAFARGRERAREELRAIGAGATAEARRASALGRAAQLRAELPLVPLYAQGLRLQARGEVGPLSFDGAGAPLLGDAWIADPGRR